MRYSRYELGYKLLIFYIYFVLFGSWLLRFLGIPENLGLSIISSLDVLPLFFWGLSNPSFRIKTNDFFVDTFKFWFFWGFLLVCLIITSYIHNGRFLPVFLHWGALIRYIPLAYAVVNLSKHIDIADQLFKHLKIITVVLIFIGYISICLGNYAFVFLPFLPENATAKRELLEGAYAAIFPNTIDYGFILVLLFAIFIFKEGLNFFKSIALLIIFFVPVFKTGSVMATIVLLLIFYCKITKNSCKTRYGVAAVLLIPIFVVCYVYWDLISWIIENAKLSRLGMITMTAPSFLSEMSFDTFFGVGCDGYVVLNKVNSFADQVHMLKYAKDGDISMLGDVYWVALLIFHGIIGVSLIIYIFYSLYRNVANHIYIDSKYDFNSMIKCFFLSIIILAIFNQVLVVKTFALVFWLVISVVYTKIKKFDYEGATN